MFFFIQEKKERIIDRTLAALYDRLQQLASVIDVGIEVQHVGLEHREAQTLAIFRHRLHDIFGGDDVWLQLSSEILKLHALLQLDAMVHSGAGAKLHGFKRRLGHRPNPDMQLCEHKVGHHLVILALSVLFFVPKECFFECLTNIYIKRIFILYKFDLI